MNNPDLSLYPHPDLNPKMPAESSLDDNDRLISNVLVQIVFFL